MSTSRSGRFVAWLEKRLNLTETLSFITTFGLAYRDIDTRLPLREAMREAFSRPQPVYVRWPHILGILAFVVFLFQGVTGMFLAFYYQPSPDAAYDSFLIITRDVHLGWYIHQMHGWGSHIFIGLLLLRLCRLFFHRAYRSPRELVWIVGVLLTLIAIYLAITGSALPWDQEAYWSFTRSAETIRQLPVVGAVFGFFIGGYDMGRFVLPRLYVLHIMALPITVMVLFYFHFATIRRIGLSQMSDDTVPERPLYPDHLLNLLTILVLLFGIILTLSVLLPSMATGQADAYTSYPGALPLWFMLPALGMIEVMPDQLAGALMMGLLTALIAAPFLDRGQEGPGRRLLTRLLFVIAMVIIAWLGTVGHSMGG
jgi:quinol-cytochrome oxidoreductase complex cytochrome b subunit